MSKTGVVFRREFAAYFATPLAYIFIVIFLATTGAFTFYLGAFFERGQADLQSFFGFLPWIFLLLIPAVAMRLWAEERKSGTIELLMTLPFSTSQVVLGKFLAAWVFVCIAILLTFPIWVTVNYLGEPDNGVIIASYLGSMVIAGGYLAIGSCISALTRNQVIAFIVSALVCFLFLTAGLEIVLAFFRDWAPAVLVDAVAGMSILTHVEAIRAGVIDLRDVIFFVSLIAAALFINVAIVDLKKAV